MKKPIILTLILSSLFLYGCGSNQPSQPMQPTQPTEPAQPTQPTQPTQPSNPSGVTVPGNGQQASQQTVTIQNYAFNPVSLTISKGTTVSRINEDTAPHSVVSDDGTFSSPATLSLGQTFSYTFNDPGTFNYHCGVHPTMKGTITVQ